MLAAEGLELRDIGQSLMELGEQLRKVGVLTEKHHGSVGEDLYGPSPESIEGMQLERDREDAIRDAMTRTLAGLRMFRGNYDYWERVAAEYALTRLGFTQRRTATLLGVGLSTINRWAQHRVATGDGDGDEQDS